MKTRTIAALPLSLSAALILCTLSGCSVLPPLSPPQTESPDPAALEVHLGSAFPEDITLSWDPEAIAVENAEVSVSEGTQDLPRTVTITIQLRHHSQP